MATSLAVFLPLELEHQAANGTVGRARNALSVQGDEVAPLPIEIERLVDIVAPVVQRARPRLIEHRSLFVEDDAAHPYPVVAVPGIPIVGVDRGVAEGS